VALVASYLILLRFITLVYLGAIGAVLLAVGAVLWLAQRQRTPISALPKQRIKNLRLAITIVFVLCAPVFWHDRDPIRQYYFVGTQGEKSIRVKESGVNGSLDSLLFYPRAVWNEHSARIFATRQLR